MKHLCQTVTERREGENTPICLAGALRHGSSTSVTVAQLTCPHLSEETTWTAKKHNSSQRFRPLSETPGRRLISVSLHTNQVSAEIQIFAKFKINNNKQNCASKDQKVLRWCKQGRAHRCFLQEPQTDSQRRSTLTLCSTETHFGKKPFFFFFFLFCTSADSNAGSKTSRPDQTKPNQTLPEKLQECSCSARPDPTHVLPAKTFDDSVIIPQSCEEGHGWRPGPCMRNMCEETTRQSGTFLGLGGWGVEKSSDSHDFLF